MSHNTMCHLAGCCCEVKKNLKKLRKLSAKPKFICMRCGRVSAKKDRVCHPERL